MRTSLFKLCLAGFSFFVASQMLNAQLVWDIDTATPGPQDGGSVGSSQWNALATVTNWWNDGSVVGLPIGNVSWTNDPSATAVFGANSGAAGTVLIPAATTNTVRDIMFKSPGSGSYTINGINVTTSKLNLTNNSIITVT